MSGDRPVALVTGAGRRVGIGAAVAQRLAHDGFDVALTHWPAYDARMPWGSSADDRVDPVDLVAALKGAGARTVTVEADLERPEAAGEIFGQVEAAVGPVSALVMCHCESVDSGLLDTTVESFDRHFAVNARATWLLVAEFGRRFRGTASLGRIVAMTSDHVVGNLPYGASKAALDRIVLAAAHELAHLGVTANVINPGATDTGWMSPAVEAAALAVTPLGRLGQPADAANLVSFLCSADGGWVNGQLLKSNGGAA
ncbi:MAG TPA: SDR family oxidoreductase [Acidimicrobiales bacterium]|jgi:3-oxoacyl-[acyl-carrier protein] reductase|nr:SDR family oxidoreductase [Acidimicrobiales bacterium]